MIAILGALAGDPAARYSWMSERAVWLYLGTLLLGGLKVWLGTMRPVAEVDETRLVVRPLHHLFQRSVEWKSVRGTEQMIGGDRMIVFYDTARGPRFVALNLNLVKGRRDFVGAVEERLAAMGFTEKIVERSRYLRAPSSSE